MHHSMSLTEMLQDIPLIVLCLSRNVGNVQYVGDDWEVQ